MTTRAGSPPTRPAASASVPAGTPFTVPPVLFAKISDDELASYRRPFRRRPGRLTATAATCAPGAPGGAPAAAAGTSAGGGRGPPSGRRGPAAAAGPGPVPPGAAAAPAASPPRARAGRHGGTRGAGPIGARARSPRGPTRSRPKPARRPAQPAPGRAGPGPPDRSRSRRRQRPRPARSAGEGCARHPPPARCPTPPGRPSCRPAAGCRRPSEQA